MMTKKTRLLLFLLLFQISLYSQQGKFVFGVESNIGISDRIFIQDESVSDLIANRYKEIEKTKIGYEAGLLIEYSLSDKVALQSGMKYVVYGYKSDKIKAMQATSEPDRIEFFQNASRNKYIEIPIKVNYYISLRKSKIFFNLGYSPSINLSNKSITRLYYPDRVETKKDEDDSSKYRKTNMVGEVGIGWEKHITDKISFFVNPNLKMQRFEIRTEAKLNRKLVFYGVSVGLKL